MVKKSYAKVKKVSSTFEIDGFTFVLHTDDPTPRTSILPKSGYNKMHFERSNADVIMRFHKALDTYVDTILIPNTPVEDDMKTS